jgi:predicted dehydrogenase
MRADLTARKLRVGIVGGGRGAFIGGAHRVAVEMGGEATLVAGALSSDPQTARDSAAAWHLDRSYDSFETMARAEAQRANGIDFVIVATPNHLHFPVAKEFIKFGIAVVCDKPLTNDLQQAQALVDLVEETGVLFALTYNYTGYAAVREARERVRSGMLGQLRKVLVEYHQDWLMQPIEQAGSKQASWRTDPARAGAGGSVGDIGTHAENLLQFVTGQCIRSVCADLSSFVADRVLDDDANILLRMEGGAKGLLSCSQVACGEANDLSIRVYGSRAGLEWRQQDAGTLTFKPAGEPWQRLLVGSPYMSAPSQAATCLPAGHPEGYLEAFAVLYRSVIADLRRRAQGESLLGDYPGVRDGLRGMRFIEGVVQSSSRGAVWLDL